MNRQMYEKAIPLYEKIIQLDITDTRAYLKKWECLEKIWEVTKGIESYDALLEINSNQTALHKKGLHFINTQKYKEALNIYLQITKQNPIDTNAHNNLWVSLLNLWRNKEATEAYKQAAILNPDNPLYYNNLWVSFREIWEEKLSVLTIFTSKLLKWEKVNIDKKYEKEKKVIERIIEEKQYDFLSRFLFSGIGYKYRWNIIWGYKLETV